MAGSVTSRAWALLLVALTLGQAIPAGVAVAPPESGVWYIDDDVTLRDGTYYINDDVQINYTGSLTVINATLVFNDSYLQIIANGAIDFDRARVLVYSSFYYSYIFTATDHASFRNSSFSAIHFKIRDGRADFTSCGFSGPGTHIYLLFTGESGNGVVLNNCTFTDIERNCVFSDGRNLVVVGCRFFRQSSDIIETEARVEAVEILPVCASVLDNGFWRLGRGITIGNGQSSFIPEVLFARSYGEEAILIRNNTFVGMDGGVQLASNDPYFNIDVTGNSIHGCTTGIDAYTNIKPQVTISRNILDGCQDGISIYSCNALINNNTITNCSRGGFYGSATYSNGLTPLIRDNTVSGCLYGAYFKNLICDFYSNNISSCARAGIFADMNSYNYNYPSYTTLEDNNITGCGFSPEPTFGLSAALWAIVAQNNRLVVNLNRLRDCPDVGIYISGRVQAENNTVENSTTGIEGAQSLPVPQEISRNRISGGRTGILLHDVATVAENDISDTGTGILCVIDETGRDLMLASNAIHSCERGIVVRNLAGDGLCATVDSNVVATSIDGVLLDSVGASVRFNDFGGTTGYCVHAMGQVPALWTNYYGRSCAGQLLQEWYLTVQALENPDPGNNTRWTYTDQFSARIRNATGELAFLGDSADADQIRLNLTGYVIDRESRRTNFTRYDLAVMKPHVGVGSATITMYENADAGIQLYPRADLAVQDIFLPSGRPVAGREAEVVVTVLHDTTYDIYYNRLGAVEVSILYDGFPFGEGLIERLEPNSTATLRFSWNVPGGTHDLTALVDPDRQIPEAFEDNNLLTIRVASNDVPVPALSVSDTGPTVGRTVAFSSQGSTDDTGVTRSLFSFGDGTDSGWTSDATALHVFGAPGIYEARLRVADAEGVESDWGPPLAVAVTEGPLEVFVAANSTAPETLVPVLLSVTAGGSPGRQLRYLWRFGDGTSEMGQSPVQGHAFARAGTYIVGVTVTDPLGRTGSATVQIAVRNRAPEAGMTLSPSRPTVLTPVHLRSLSGDPDGVVARWRWDLGDGNQSSDPEPVHAYKDKGAYTVTLEVQDDFGAWSAPAMEQLTVFNIAPSARATTASAAVRAGEPVRLDAWASDDPDDPFRTLSFLWSSPDGWAALGQNASRQYDAPGLHRITLTVTDDSGASSQDTVTVQVLPADGAGGLPYRGLAIALLVAAAGVFAVALVIFGRGLTVGGPRATRSDPSVRSGGGKSQGGRKPASLRGKR